MHLILTASYNRTTPHNERPPNLEIHYYLYKPLQVWPRDHEWIVYKDLANVHLKYLFPSGSGAWNIDWNRSTPIWCNTSYPEPRYPYPVIWIHTYTSTLKFPARVPIGMATMAKRSRVFLTAAKKKDVCIYKQSCPKESYELIQGHFVAQLGLCVLEHQWSLFMLCIMR